MFRRAARSLRDRILAAIEIPALGLWLGALCGFAFIFAPTAFHTVTQLDEFAALTSQVLGALSWVGGILGTLAVLVALVRSIAADDRRNDFVRVGLVIVALGFLAVETYAIVPAMAAIPDLRSEAYHALHQRSTIVYGGVVVCVFAALVLAAIRSDD